MRKKEPEHCCPVCGYDQSGVVASWKESCPLDGVCSECGSAFRWQEIYRPDLFADARFAEDPRSEKWKGLARTGVRVAMPKRFWTEASRTQPLAVWRIIGSVIAGSGITTTLPLLITAGLVSLLLNVSYTHWQAMYQSQQSPLYRAFFATVSVPNPFTGVKQYYLDDRSLNESFFVLGLTLHLITVMIAGGWALLARSRGVRLVHVARIGLYGLVAVPWLLPLDVLYHGLIYLQMYDQGRRFAWSSSGVVDSFTGMLSFWTPVVSLIWLWRWWSAYMIVYLQARRPRLTVLLYGVMSGLMLLAVYAVFVPALRSIL